MGERQIVPRTRVTRGQWSGSFGVVPGHCLDGRWALGIAVVALAYRALFLLVAGDHPFLNNPIIDASGHHHWAQRILAGDTWGHGPDDVFKPPLYPYVLAGLYATLGTSIRTAQWFQYALGALTCVLTAVLGTRLLGHRTGRIAGIMAALYAPFVFFESQLLAEPLAMALGLGVLLVLLPAPHTGLTAETGIRRMRAVLAGLLLSLLAATRPAMLLPAGLVSLYVLGRRVPGEPNPRRAMAWRSACLLAGITIILAPISLRNASLTGEFLPLASHAGINLYTGNRAGADGVSTVPVGLRWERLVARVPQAVLEHPGEANRWWVARTGEEIAAHPVDTLTRLARKAVAFFHHRECRNNISYDFLQARIWPLRPPFLQFWMVLPLALAGIAMLWGAQSGRRSAQRSAQRSARRSAQLGRASPSKRASPHKRHALMIILLWAGGVWMVAWMFFVAARYRLPVVPVLIIPAAWALSQGWELVRAKQWRQIAIPAAALLTGLLLAWQTWLAPPPNDWVRDYVNLGQALREVGDLAGEEEAYRTALAITDDPDAHYLLGRSLLAGGKPRTASSHFAAALDQVADSPDLLFASAQAQLVVGDRAAAKKTLEQLLAASETSNLWPKRSTWAKAHVVLAELAPADSAHHWAQAWAIDPATTAEAAFLGGREPSRVLETFRQQRDQRPWDWYAQANYGIALLRRGQAAQAIAPLRRAARLAPEREALRFHYARALVEAGRLDEAQAILEQLVETLPPTPLRQDVVALVTQLGGSPEKRTAPIANGVQDAATSE